MNFNGNGFDISKYLGGKNVDELTIKELSFIHLDYHNFRHKLKTCYLSSNLYHLTETLSCSFNNKRTSQYVPLMTSFAILDQIGCLYSPLGKSSKYKNGIKRALDLFSEVPESHLNLLVTLRHGLFHDGSLISRNDKTKTYVFFRMITDSGKLISEPDSHWDGVFKEELSHHTTRIDLKELQKLTLNVLDTCLKLLKIEELEISLKDPKELFYKYLFGIDL
ncbi:hypothetical protein D0907_11945 [Pseudoalteromonas lipolytica]|uniref:Uncharacterized protein n=1 Tax=Pseudoalteromonas lipolytica TaxID=570156 RepID=A0AAD0S0Q4_9GAMM|nr:hypothetical protein [Pseudoalteromonas donghaensis]AXV65930.1 hypothetical protein D0907_11945 [Pseudoalteromonas donghaensis]